MSEKTKQPKSKSRRRFFKRAGIVLGGTVVAIYFGRHIIRRKVYSIASGMQMPAGIINFDTDLWFEVLPDNTVRLKSPKVEMGQGIFTGLAMLAAEELDVHPTQIKVEPGSSKNSAADFAGTGGSGTTLGLYEPIREVAATLREMLKSAAAKHWGIDVSQIQTADGELFANGKKMTYAEVVKVTEKWDKPKAPKLRPRSGFKYVGTDMPRVDLRPKVMGEALFAIDADFPDMRYAVKLECPYIGGKLKNVDFDLAKKIPGVEQVVRDGDLVAVVATNRYSAEMGMMKLQAEAEWEVPKKYTQADFDELVTVGKSTKISLQKEGSPGKYFQKEEADVYRQEYRTPLGAHAQLEPNGAVAHVEKGRATVHIGTQNISFVMRDLASAIGMDSDNIEIKNAFLGGGFGRRFFKSVGVDAARISQIIGKPVGLFRTRESEFQNGFYRPSTHHVLQATLNADGSIEAIQHDLATGDMGVRMLAGNFGVNALGMDLFSAAHGAKFIYDIKNKSANGYHAQMPVVTTIWRAIGMFPNTFAIESFLDELARKSGQDAMQFRLRHLTGKAPLTVRTRKALEAAAPAWNAPKPEGTGRGIALGEDRGTTAVAVVDVRETEGKIRVVKVTQVIDPGVAVNPEGIRQQVEGSVMMGMSAAMYEGLFVEDGKISASNYHLYPIAMMRDTPEIEVVILENADSPSGVGEPPMAPMAPAIANAVFDLTGERKREVPFF